MAMQDAPAAPPLERRVLDALPNTVYSVDLEGRITSVNATWGDFARANGAPQIAAEDAVIGRVIWEAASDPAARAQMIAAMDELRAGRSGLVSWEFPCSSPEVERMLLMQVSPIRDGHSLTGFVFSTVDITPSHRSREALIDAGIALSRTIALERVFHEAAHQLRRVVPGDGLAIAMVGGDPAAPRLAFMQGFDGEAGEAIEERLHPRWQDVIEHAQPAVFAVARGVLELHVPMTSSGGSSGAITVRSSRLVGAERVDEALRVIATIAAQTAAAVERAALVRRVEQKRRLEAVGEVSAGVAHELRNPLFGISSAAQLLRFRAKDDPVVEKNVGRILREVERLNRMVTSLLEFGRPAPARFTTGDPDAVWDDVLEGERGRLEARGLRFDRTRATPAARVAFDPEQLAQVFVNVLVNAVDAAPEHSVLTLASEQLSMGWRCRLHNGGPPVPPENLGRVFEVFFSTKPGGTGIGLALCQRIVEEHGGTIALESDAGSGTTLTITLPAAP
ncbi:MAG: PAS domain-containing protein [Gemmatimonadaceae bacterium]|nr:PAS domain-containing protein [Gemmatimonadaceae bacterium]